MAANVHDLRRVTRWFWVTTGTSVALTGAMSTELSLPSGPMVGFLVALTGVALALCVTQATRLMMALHRSAPPGSKTRLPRSLSPRRVTASSLHHEQNAI